MQNQTRRVLSVLAFACAAMIIMTLVTPLTTEVGNKWMALGAAATVMIAAIPIHRMAYQKQSGRKRPLLWVVCWLMNSVANGLSVAALYIHAEQTVNAGELLQGMLPAMTVMAATAAGLISFPARKKLVLWTAGILAAALAVASWIPAVWDAQPQRSMMLMGALTAICYLFVYGRIVGREERVLLREISLGSFGALILVTFAVLVLISDGEALDGLDGLDLGDAGGDGASKRRGTKEGNMLCDE